MCDTKSSGLRSVVLKKNNHGISIYHCENRLDNPNDFIYSLNGPVHGMWFKYGDVARMYPGKNSEFISAKFSNL